MGKLVRDKIPQIIMSDGKNPDENILFPTPQESTIRWLSA